MIAASIPSPPISSVALGPLTIHFYALCILAGIVVATILSRRRWAARGGNPDTILDILFWAVPFGIVGARIYSVFTTPDPYFGPNGNPLDAFKIWQGGLGIWGGVAFGAVGALIGARRAGVRLVDVADVMAPTILLAQAIGRLGNWFNQELYGGPTDLPWAVAINCQNGTIGGCVPGTYHPTFLYELLWNTLMFFVLITLERRFRLAGGQVIWGYVMLYTLGRVWIEMMRTDNAEIILGLRLNVWTSILVFLLGLVMFALAIRRGRREFTAPTRLSAQGSLVLRRPSTASAQAPLVGERA